MTTKPTEPVTKPTEPDTKPTEPVTKPTEPITTTAPVDICDDFEEPMPISRAVDEGKCIDLNMTENKKKYNIKLFTTDGYSTKDGAKASVMCTQGYQLNLEGKDRTAAYCTCDENSGLCSWKFNKGDIKCVKCPKPTGSRPKGKGVMIFAGSKVVNFDDDTMSVVYMVKPYPKSTAGWTIGLQFPAGLSDDVTADDAFNTLKLTKISKNRTYFEFQATQGFSNFDATAQKRVPFVITFRNTSGADRENIMVSELHYFSQPQQNTHCHVDRFDCFPLE
jgi:hypothetical protein